MLWLNLDGIRIGLGKIHWSIILHVLHFVFLIGKDEIRTASRFNEICFGHATHLSHVVVAIGAPGAGEVSMKASSTVTVGYANGAGG